MRLHALGIHVLASFERVRTFVAELRRRRVVHTALLYVGGSAALLQGADVVIPALGFSTAVLRPLTILAIFGLPVALILSWEFDVKSASQAEGKAHRKWPRFIPVVVIAALSILGARAAWTYRYGVAAAVPEAVAKADPAHVAVMPFTVTSPDAELAAFAFSLQNLLIDGLTEAARATMPEGRRLRVISAAGIRPFSTGGAALDSIRRSLEVGTVLDGSVESYGDRMRVRVSMVDTESGDQVASSVIEKSAHDPLGMVGAVADSVLLLVRQQLGPLVRNRARRLETNNVDAFNVYTVAMRRLGDLSVVQKDVLAARAVLDDADAFLAHAERRDPRWIEPIVQRGYIAHERSRLEDDPRSEAAIVHVEAGIRHANRAVKLQPRDYRALELRGRLLHRLMRASPQTRRIELAAKAEQDLLAALTHNPNPALSYRLLSELAWDTGRMEEAVAYGKSAYAEDPYLEDVQAALFRTFEYALALGRDRDAEQACREGRRRFSEAVFDDCRLQLAAWAQYSMSPDSAREVLQHELTAYAGQVPRGLQSRLALLYAAVLIRNHMADSARIILADALGNAPAAGGTLKAAAGVYMLLGEPDSAVLMVRRLLAVVPEQRGVLDRAPELRLLRAHPSFHRLTSRH